jgi:hypothetical protein
MASDYKFGILEPEDREWTYSDVWATEETTGGGSRLVIAPSQGQIKLLAALLGAMSGPFWVLYVLIIPRARGEQGRYQSPEPQAASAVETLLNEFSEFLEGDGRHNLWIASESGSEVLVYDRHNVIYAYGPLASWRLLLATNEFDEVPEVLFPSPHSHHYHPGLDSEENRLLAYWDWHRTPLRESDEE